MRPRTACPRTSGAESSCGAIPGRGGVEAVEASSVCHRLPIASRRSLRMATVIQRMASRTLRRDMPQHRVTNRVQFTREGSQVQILWRPPAVISQEIGNGLTNGFSWSRFDWAPRTQSELDEIAQDRWPASSSRTAPKPSPPPIPGCHLPDRLRIRLLLPRCYAAVSSQGMRWW